MELIYSPIKAKFGHQLADLKQVFLCLDKTYNKYGTNY